MPWIAAAEDRADALARPQGPLERPPGGDGPRGRTQRERHMPDRAFAVDAPAGREAQVSGTRNQPKCLRLREAVGIGSVGRTCERMRNDARVLNASRAPDQYMPRRELTPTTATRTGAHA